VSTSEERVTLSRDTIVEVARTLLTEGGLDQLSLRRLAAHLGVTAPALYAHVDDKWDLLRGIAETGFADLIARYETIRETDPMARVRAMTRAYVEEALAEPEVFRLMFLFRPREIEAGDADNVLDRASEAFEYPLAAIADAIEAGAIHPDRDPLLCALTMWTVSHGLANVLLLGIDFGPDQAERLITSVLDATLAGLALPPTGEA
jgi:AcrR family transcriptional regulator